MSSVYKLLISISEDHFAPSD